MITLIVNQPCSTSPALGYLSECLQPMVVQEEPRHCRMPTSPPHLAAGSPVSGRARWHCGVSSSAGIGIHLPGHSGQNSFLQ